MRFSQNNLELTRYQTTASQLQYFPHRRTPLLTLVIVRRRLARNTLLQIQGPDILSLWEGRTHRSKLQSKPKQTPKTPPQNAQVHTVEYNETGEYKDLLSLKIHFVSNPGRNVIWVDLKEDGKPLKMELGMYTGSVVSIITHELYMKISMRYPYRKLNCS